MLTNSSFFFLPTLIHLYPLLQFVLCARPLLSLAPRDDRLADLTMVSTQRRDIDHCESLFCLALGLRLPHIGRYLYPRVRARRRIPLCPLVLLAAVDCIYVPTVHRLIILPGHPSHSSRYPSRYPALLPPPPPLGSHKYHWTLQ